VKTKDICEELSLAKLTTTDVRAVTDSVTMGGQTSITSLTNR